jgi:hypothetical protein
MSVGRSVVSGGLATAFVAVALVASGAEEQAFAGRAVRRDVSDARGNRFAVTVTPPADRAVDTRFFDAIEVTDGESGAVDAATADAGGEPVDVSGYVVELERLSAAATCTTQISLKTKPVNLAGKKTFSVTSSAPPIFAAVTTFPKSGNVDALVLDGSTPCNSSTKAAGSLDNATCVSSTCTGSSILIGQVKNPATSSAQYVAAFNFVFSN